jgi:hypothetical protein
MPNSKGTLHKRHWVEWLKTDRKLNCRARKTPCSSQGV